MNLTVAFVWIAVVYFVRVLLPLLWARVDFKNLVSVYRNYRPNMGVPRPDGFYKRDMGLPSTDGLYKPDLARWIAAKDGKPLITVRYAMEHWQPCYMPVGSLFCDSEDWKGLWGLGKCSEDGKFLYAYKIYTNFTQYPSISEEEWGTNKAMWGQRELFVDFNASKESHCDKPYIQIGGRSHCCVYCVLPKQYLLSVEGYYYYYGDQEQPYIAC